MANKFFILLAFLLACGGVKPVQASEPGRQVKVAVPIISQLVVKQEDGTWGGPLIDLLKRAEQEAGLPFHLRMVPFKRAVVMVENGATDFGVFLESPKRNKLGMPVVKLGDAHMVVVSLKDRAITSLADLKDKKVARVRGGTEIRTLNGVPGLEYYYFNTPQDGMNLLTFGRVDALVTADFRLLDALDKNLVSIADLAEPVLIEARELWLYWSWQSDLSFHLIRRLKNSPNLTLDALDPQKVRERYKRKP